MDSNLYQDLPFLNQRNLLVLENILSDMKGGRGLCLLEKGVIWLYPNMFKSMKCFCLENSPGSKLLPCSMNSSHSMLSVCSVAVYFGANSNTEMSHLVIRLEGIPTYVVWFEICICGCI